MAHRDPDLVLVDSMLAPPPLADARSSLEYWQQRRRALPLHRRSARQEAREMADRWEGRVRAAQQARFDASLIGRALAALGISSVWVRGLRFNKRGVLAAAWMFVPPKLKLIAGAVVLAWLSLALAVTVIAVVLFAQLIGW
jgi:hypothetical protein